MINDIIIGQGVICRGIDIFHNSITFGAIYEVVDYDSPTSSIRIITNDGNQRWYNMDTFDCITLKRDKIIENILK